jgi:Tfp pilus assembly major pilin PilA
MIPIADLLGAGLLTLAGVTCVVLAIAGLQYTRYAGKNTASRGEADLERAQSQNMLIKIQAQQTRIQRQNSKLLREIQGGTDTNTGLLRKALDQLTLLTSAQEAHNGNANDIRALMNDIRMALNRKA